MEVSEAVAELTFVFHSQQFQVIYALRKDLGSDELPACSRKMCLNLMEDFGKGHKIFVKKKKKKSSRWRVVRSAEL